MTKKKNTRRSLFFAPDRDAMWDTWVCVNDDTYYLYYLIKKGQNMIGVALAISDDGVHWKDEGNVVAKAADAIWLGTGAVWPTVDNSKRQIKFIMNFSEWRGESFDQGEQTICFAESNDLIRWERLDASFEFRPDTRWYEFNGRWDSIWPVPRSTGGYFGYWTATPKSKSVGFGFGQSADGISWEALEPPVLCGVPLGPPSAQSPEIAAAYHWKGNYYVLAGLDDLKPNISADASIFRPGATTFIAESPGGPFVPAPKNRRLLVGNASYFPRFIETPGGILVNHHSWEIGEGRPLDVDDNTPCLAPLKVASWDDEGTLRLKWWTGNESAKSRRLVLESHLIDTAFDPGETLILEGIMHLATNPSGIFLQGDGEKGTALLVRSTGLVEYGNIYSDGAGFERIGFVDRELSFGDKVFFRLIRRGRITEFYIDDYLMQCYCLPDLGLGRIGLIGKLQGFHGLKAWYCE